MRDERTAREIAQSVAERYESLLPGINGGRLFCDVMAALLPEDDAERRALARLREGGD